MDYIVICLIGVLGGGFGVFIALDAKRRLIQAQKRHQDLKEERISNEYQSIKSLQSELQQRSDQLNATLDQEKQKAHAELEQEKQQVHLELAKMKTVQDAREARLLEAHQKLKTEIEHFEKQTISYTELHDENIILKRDLS